VDGKIKFTEQGEVITYRYGNAATATYELTVDLDFIKFKTLFTMLPMLEN
jgi:phosphoenolpyruvate carboxylase